MKNIKEYVNGIDIKKRIIIIFLILLLGILLFGMDKKENIERGNPESRGINDLEILMGEKIKE